MTTPLVKLTGPNRRVWFLSEDGETITHIRDCQKTFPLGGSASGEDKDTWRPIQIDGTDVLTDSNTSLNFKAGTNVSITYENDELIISATDTTYSEAVPSSDGVGGSPGLMSATDKEKLNKLSGESTEDTLADNSVALQLVQNTITYCTSDALTSLSITGADVDFVYCTIIFSSPSTATQFSMPNNGYYCVGDNCSEGVFTPVADMRYNLAAMREYDRIAIYVAKAL